MNSELGRQHTAYIHIIVCSTHRDPMEYLNTPIIFMQVAKEAATHCSSLSRNRNTYTEIINAYPDRSR